LPATLTKFIKVFGHIKRGRCYYISVENNIIQMHTTIASNTISESDYGIYTVDVYEDLVKLRELDSQYETKID